MKSSMLVPLFFWLQTGAGAPPSAHALALQTYGKHAWAEAATQFSAAMKTEKPDSAEYRESVLFLGQSLYYDRKFAESIPWLEKAAAGKEKPLEAAYMLGQANLRTLQDDRAVRAFAQLFALAPESAGAHVVTAQMMLHLQLEDRAAQQASRALALDARAPEAHYILGEVAIYRGELDQAVAELNKEIEMNPGFAMAYYRLGDAYSRRDQWDNAIAPLERSIWLNPDFSGPYILLARHYVKIKNFSDAEGFLRHALRVDPQNSAAHYLLGQTLMQTGREDEGRKELARSRELRE